MDKIRNETQYNEVMALIEKHIAKATEAGGFSGLADAGKEEPGNLSALAEPYEDRVLTIMPVTGSK